MTLDLRSLGRPYVAQTLKEWFGNAFDFEEVYAYCHVLTDKIMTERGIQLKPGTLEILTWLRKEHITAAIATSNGITHATAKLKRAGLEGYFDRVICADMVEFGKPAPDTYAYACRELGLAPDRTFAVEDSPNGVRSAHGAGCKVIMVPDLTEPDEELKKLLYAKVDTLADIKGLVYEVENAQR